MIKLPTPVADYVEAANARDPERVAAAFLTTATVHDEGKLRRGREEIAAWASETAVQYGFTIAPRSIDETDGRCTVHAEVSGNFPGSPATLAFHFALHGDAIASLEIKP